jgi:hypothetical protein
MRTRFVLALALAGGTALALPLNGCKSRNSGFYVGHSYQDRIPASSGSLADLKRTRAGAQAKPQPAAKPQTIWLLVAHDAAGKPQAVYVWRSSGDADLDAKAQQMVHTKWKFPAGRTNTVIVSIEPKKVR